MHGFVNLLGIVGETPLFDTASWSTELTWMTVLDVTQNEAVYKGRDNNKQVPTTLIDRPDTNYFGLGDQLHADVVPGVPGRGHACAAVVVAGHLRQLGGHRRAATRRRHFRHRHRSRHPPEVPLRPQVRRLLRRLLAVPAQERDHPARTCAVATGSMDVNNGVTAAISDRDFVALTFKTTF